MEDTQPGKVALSKEPIAVEESRAQRLQRQQARFRDRGGIFVPSNRNTLIDILLGRKAASPKQGRAHSALLSPQKAAAKRCEADEDSDDGAPKPLRTSPRKAAQRRAEAEGPSRFSDEEIVPKTCKRPGAKSTNTAATTTTIPTTASKKGKAKSAKIEKPAPKRRGRRPKVSLSNVDDDEPTMDTSADKEQLPKSKPKRVTKASPKRAAKNAEPLGVTEMLVEEYPPRKAKAKSEPKDTAKRTTKKAISSAPECNVGDVDPVGASRNHDPSNLLSTKSKGAKLDHVDDRAAEENAVPKSLKKLKTSQVEDDNMVSTLAQKTGSHADRTEARDSTEPKGKEKARQIAVEGVEDDEPSAKASGKKIAHPMQTSGDDGLAPKDAGTSKVTKKRARVELDKGTETHKVKRTKVASPEDDDPPPRRGRSKAEAHPPAAKATKKNGNASVDQNVSEVTPNVSVSPASTKRSHEPDQDKASRTKRAKVSEKSENARQEDDMAAGREANKEQGKAREAPSKTSHTQDPAPINDTKARKTSSKAKRNANLKPVAVPKLRPRKSVMQRIKEPLPQIEDDEPDPINFLC